MEVVDFQEMTFISGSGVRFISPTTNDDVHYYFYARLKVTVTGISDTDIKMCCSSRPLFLTLVFFEYLSPLLHLCTLHIMAWKTDAMSRTKKIPIGHFLLPNPMMMISRQQPAHRYGYCQSVGVAVLHIARSMRRRVKFSGPRSVRMGKIIKSILKISSRLDDDDDQQSGIVQWYFMQTLTWQMMHLQCRTKRNLLTKLKSYVVTVILRYVVCSKFKAATNSHFVR